VCWERFDALEVLREQGLFDKEGLVRLQKSGELFRHWLVDSAMEANSSVHPEGFNRFEPINAVLESRWAIKPAQVFCAVHFHGFEALCLACTPVEYQFCLKVISTGRIEVYDSML
jgi:hypothetical protein